MTFDTGYRNTRSRERRVMVALAIAAAAFLVTLPLPELNFAAESPEKEGPTLKTVTLRSRHRAFEYFVEDHRVALAQAFQIGDSEFEGKILRYVPDFALAMESRRIFSRTPEPNNPAFQIAVFLDGEPQDTSWAFLKMPPHFGRKSLIAFQVLQIDFEDREPLVNRDTTRAELPPLEGAPHGGEAPR